MADADVIPIGGRGRPGRGSRTSPSAAARALAPTVPRAPRRARSAEETGGDATTTPPRRIAGPKRRTGAGRGATAPGIAPSTATQTAQEPADTTTAAAKAPATKAAGTKTRPTKAAATKTSPTKAAATKTSPTKAAGTRTRPTKAAGTKARATKATGTKTPPTKAAGTKTRPTKTRPTKAAGTKARAAEADGTKTRATKVAGTKAPASKAADSRPTPTKRAAPRLVAVGGPDTTYSADDVADAVASAAKEVLGEASWERKLAGVLAFVRRRITGDYEVDEFGFDADITDRFLLTAMRPLAEKWFRVEVRGIDNVPADGGALVVSNHSGTVPVDGLVTGLVIHDHAHRRLRMLGADLVFTMPFIGELARKGGATLASNEDAERMLSRGDLVGVWPEGYKGIGKPFSERYKLQRFGRGGFVSAALRTGVPIVPCSVVGAEEIYPLVGNIPSLARLLKVPYIPITPFFPLLGPLGLIPLPSKWLIEFGEPIRTDSYGEGAADDPMLVFNVTDQVRETIQQTLYSLLIQRRSPFS